MDWASQIGSMKVGLITGASTGVGLATARRLLEEGHFVILTAKRDSLSRFASHDFLKKFPNHWIRPLDVRSPGERRELMDHIENEFGRLDFLINNAAVIYRSPIELTFEFEGKEQMLVNFHAPLELIRCALPLLRRSKRAKIINVSSAAGFMSIPSMGMYAASKHALEAASEALRYELAPWNISVSLVEPGFLQSDAYLGARPGMAMARGLGPWISSYLDQTQMVSGLIEKASAMTTTTPSDVANTILAVLRSEAPPLRVKATLDAKVFSFLKRFLPSSVFERLLSRCLQMLMPPSPRDEEKLVDIYRGGSYSINN